jgi:hypothetical protein
MIGSVILERMAAGRGVEEGMMPWLTGVIVTTSEREGAFDLLGGRRQDMACKGGTAEMVQGLTLTFLVDGAA